MVMMDSTKVKRANKIPVLSFFTGAGLLDIGFIRNGFDVVWHNENNESFATGFEYGMSCLFPDARNETVRIQERNPIQSLSASRILDGAFQCTGRPELFGVIGGPPCPDFSNGGKHLGSSGANGILTANFIDQILSIEPTFFLIENVPGMVKTKKHRIFLAKQMRRLEASYLVEINFLNALDFGAPQDRNRLFIIGFSKNWLGQIRDSQPYSEELNWELYIENLRQMRLRNLSTHGRARALPIKFDDRWFKWPRDPNFDGSKYKYDWPDLHPFGGTPKKPDKIPNELMVWSSIGDEERLERLPNGADCFQPYSGKFKTVQEGYIAGKSFKRLHRWRYSPPAAYGNNEVHLHPSKPRRLSVREVMRIQTVPDAYALPESMTLSDKFKTIANGVPVILSEALAKSVDEFIKDDGHIPLL